MKRIILCVGIAALLTGLSGCVQAQQTRYRQHLGVALKPIKANGSDSSLARNSFDFSGSTRRR